MKNLAIVASFALLVGFAASASAEVCVQRSCNAGTEEEPVDGSQTVCCPDPSQESGGGDQVCGAVGGTVGGVDSGTYVAGCGKFAFEVPTGCIQVAGQGGYPSSGRSCDEAAVDACESCNCATYTECVAD